MSQTLPRRPRAALLAALLTLPVTALPAFAAPAFTPIGPGASGVVAASARGEAISASSAATVGDTYIVSFKPGTVSTTGAARAGATGAKVLTRLDRVFSGAIVRATQAQARALAQQPGVARVTPDQIVTGDITQAGAPWGLDRLDQRSRPTNGSYIYTPSGRGVTAYVIDSGIRPSHSDFGGRVQPGVYVTEIGTSTLDCHGHGTHTSGTIGGRTYGVAKSVSLVPVRVLDCNNRGTVGGFIAGLEWVADHHEPGQPAVANMSLGSDSPSPELDAAVKAVIDDGVSVAVAAGNDSVSACTGSPGRLPAAITVGATTSTDARAAYSNYGSCLDVFAPGDQITSAGHTSDTGTAVMSGTSMATPHVAGAVALYLENRRTASPAAVADAVRNAATTGKVTSAGSGSANRLLYTGSFTSAAAPGTFWALRPQRILDTRTGVAVAAGATRTITVSGRGGVPATGVGAVVLNVTVTQPRSAGNLVVHPAGSAAPTASHLNFVTGQTIANLVTVRLGTNGQVSVRNNSSGTSHVLVDVAGYYVAGTAAYNGTFASLNPARILDTRSASPVAAGATQSVQVTGRGGVPASGVGAVVLNVTVTQPRAAGNLTAHPAGTAAPTASNVNFTAGQTIPNAVVVRVGTNGQVNLKNNSAGTSHVIADVAGYYRAGTPTVPGSFVALNPARILDSRGGTPLPARGAGGVPVAGKGGVPTSGVAAAMLNVTVTQPASAGNVTVYPNGSEPPAASTVNFVAGQTIPNLAAAKVGSGGAVVALNNSGGSLHLVVDVAGYFKG